LTGHNRDRVVGNSRRTQNSDDFTFDVFGGCSAKDSGPASGAGSLFQTLDRHHRPAKLDGRKHEQKQRDRNHRQFDRGRPAATCLTASSFATGSIDSQTAKS
jgi:hypothetical protein